MKHSIDEILLQRCVDGELSDHERAELLRRLNDQGSIENWKTLALSFIEHQVFSKVFTEGAHSGEMLSFQLARPAAAEPVSPPVKNVHWLHRQVRPWFSLAASLLVGMTVGVAGHFWLQDAQQPMDQQLAEATQSASDISGAGAGVREPVRSAAQTPMMNVHLSGLGNHGSEPVSIPVYSPEQWTRLHPGDHSVQLTEDLRRMLEAQGMTVDHERQWYRAPLEDGREILVPAEFMRVRHTIQ